MVFNYMDKMISFCILVVMGEIVVRAIMKCFFNDNNKSKLAFHSITAFLGTIVYETAKLEMEFSHYTWEGHLTSHEEYYYFLRYFGLVLILFGIIGAIFCFYDIFKSKQ